MPGVKTKHEGPVRPLHVIADEVATAWKDPYFAARPLIAAMRALRTINESYGLDDGEEIVIRFLSNASSFTGPTARALKEELKAHLAGRELIR